MQNLIHVFRAFRKDKIYFRTNQREGDNKQNNIRLTMVKYDQLGSVILSF